MSKAIIDPSGTFWKPFLFYINDYKTLINNAHLLLIEKNLPSETVPHFFYFFGTIASKFEYENLRDIWYFQNWFKHLRKLKYLFQRFRCRTHPFSRTTYGILHF